jgi:hypothetical protein
MLLPRRKKCLVDTEDPKLTKSNTLRESPHLLHPYALKLDERRAKARRLTLEPSDK